MTREKAQVSLNEQEQEEVKFLSKRFGISNVSELFKKAVRLTHRYYDHLQFNISSVPQEFLELESDKLRYGQETLNISFKEWLKQNKQNSTTKE